MAREQPIARGGEVERKPTYLACVIGMCTGEENGLVVLPRYAIYMAHRARPPHVFSGNGTCCRSFHGDTYVFLCGLEVGVGVPRSVGRRAGYGNDLAGRPFGRACSKGRGGRVHNGGRSGNMLGHRLAMASRHTATQLAGREVSALWTDRFRLKVMYLVVLALFACWNNQHDAGQSGWSADNLFPQFVSRSLFDGSSTAVPVGSLLFAFGK